MDTRHFLLIYFSRLNFGVNYWIDWSVKIINQWLEVKFVVRRQKANWWHNKDDGLNQESSNYGPQAKSCLAPVLGNKILLEHSQSRAFTYCLQLISCYRGCTVCGARSIYRLAFHRKGLLTSGRDDGSSCSCHESWPDSVAASNTGDNVQPGFVIYYGKWMRLIWIYWLDGLNCVFL